MHSEFEICSDELYATSNMERWIAFNWHSGTGPQEIWNAT